MGKEIVPVANHKICFTAHAGVDGILRKQVAKDCICSIGGNAANVIARVQILDANWQVMLFEIECYFLLKEFSDVVLEDIP